MELGVEAGDDAGAEAWALGALSLDEEGALDSVEGLAAPSVFAASEAVAEPPSEAGAELLAA